MVILVDPQVEDVAPIQMVKNDLPDHVHGLDVLVVPQIHVL